MANEAIAWSLPPSVTDATDGAGASYNMGRGFTLASDRPIVGVRWRVPDSAPAPSGGPIAIALWNDSTGVRLAYKELVPTPGADRDLLFDAPYSGLTTDSYVVSVYTNHYAYRSGADIGATSPSGAIVAGTSRLAPFNGSSPSAPWPTGTTTLNFFVSPLISLGTDPEVHTTVGTAALAATATATSATVRARAGIAALVPTATATVATVRARVANAAVYPVATAMSTTVRARAALAEVLVTVTATSATVRATAAAAPVYVTATAITPERHVTVGTAALSVAATAIVRTVRARTGTAPVYVTARQYRAATAPGPWLAAGPRNGTIQSARRQARIVTGTQVAS